MPENDKAPAGNGGSKPEKNPYPADSLLDQQKVVNLSVTPSPSTEKPVSKPVSKPSKPRKDYIAFDELDRRITLRDFIVRQGVREERGDSQHDVFICPFHNDTQGSLKIWHRVPHAATCHAGCGTFNNIQFAKKKMGWSFFDVFREMAEMAGCADKLPPWVNGKQTKRSSKPRPVTKVEEKKNGKKPKEPEDNTTYTDEETHHILDFADKTFLREHYYTSADPVHKKVLYRYTNKEGRPDKTALWWTAAGNGLWLKGRRGDPSLYNQAALEGDDLKIVTEGCQDANTCAAHGLSAVTHGGATDWHPEFVEKFRDKDVVLLPDNDKSGAECMDKIATAIYPVAKSVKIVNLPNLEEKEDITDWLEKRGGTIEKLMELVESTEVWIPVSQEPTEEEQEATERLRQAEELAKICGINYVPVLPDKNLFVEGFLAEAPWKKDGEPIKFSPPYVIDGFVTDPRTQDSYLFLKGAKGGHFVLNADMTDKSFSKMLTTFQGISFDDNKLKANKRYISNYQMVNTIKTLRGLSRTGWDDTDPIFHIPLIPSENTIWLDDDIAEAYRTKGSKDLQTAMIKKVCTTKAGMVILASLSATLMKWTTGENYIINIHGSMHGGKTTSALLALSLLGNPNKQMITWNGTSFGIEQRLSSLMNMPFLIDERATGHQGGEDLVDFAFRYISRHGRQQGSPGVKARKVKDLEGIVITTAEMSLNESIKPNVNKQASVHRGTFRRIFEIDGDKDDLFLMPDGTKISIYEINQFVMHNYGYFGADWFSYITGNIQSIKEKFDRYLVFLSKHFNLYGLDHLLATMLASLSAMVGMGIIGEETQMHLERFILQNAMETHEKLAYRKDIVQEFCDKISGWVMDNIGSFIETDAKTDANINIPDRQAKIKGVIKGHDLFLTNNASDEFMRHAGLVGEHIYRRLFEKGILRKHKSEKGYRYKQSINGKHVPGHYFMDIFSKEAGKEEDKSDEQPS